MKPWVSEEHDGCECNFLNELRSTFHLPELVQFHDSTLRDGEQTPGVVFTKEKKLEIATLLDDLGVDRIEAGMPAVSQEDFQAVKEIVELKLKAKIFVFCRALESDIDKAAEAGVQGIIMEIPAGYSRITKQFPQWTFDDVVKNAVKAINYAKSKDLYVAFFPYDSTRGKIDFLETLYKAAMNAGADSVALVDTLGGALPQSIYYLVRKIKSWGDAPVEIHSHNDWGLGVAGTLAAVEAGAEVVHGCITGLGERTGNAALEQIALGLKFLLGVETKIDVQKLYATCLRVSQLSNVPIPMQAPVMGDVAYSREVGLGAKMMVQAPTVVFPVNPIALKRKPRLVMGKKSGKDSVKIKLDEYSLPYDDALVAQLVDKVKDAGIKKGTYLADEEFLAIYNTT